jgi:chromosome segregation ATPase
MARGRHVRRTGLFARLWPGRADRRRTAHLRERIAMAEVWDLRGEVHRLRGVGTQLAGRSAEATSRARRAEDRVARLEAEVAALRTELSELREHAVWAWSAQRVREAAEPVGAVVVDLRDQARSG